MFIPYSTDAPIYHYPKATIGVIAANVAIHVAWSLGPSDAAEPYLMILGDGLHPLQWLTHNFLHIDFMHIGFNMIFLWAYGIIVEGKIGWLPFLGCYLGIGIVHGAVIQAAYLHAAEPTYVLGASGIIFGLMAIAMIWAPVNELHCFYFFFVGFRILTGTLEWPIYAFALLQIALEGASIAFTFLIRGDPMSSGLLHVSGAFWGLWVGILLLKLRWVDCEDYDVFSIVRKRRALREAWRSREARLDRNKAAEQQGSRPRRHEEDRPDLSPEERAAKLLARVHKMIEAGDMTAFQAASEKWMGSLGNRAPREALLGIVKALHAREHWAESVPTMRALCRLHPQKAEKVRLMLASILIRTLERPTEAHRQLQLIDESRLEPSHRQTRRKLLEEADRMIEEGVLEIEEDA